MLDNGLLPGILYGTALFLSNERTRCVYRIVSRFIAFKYKLNKYIYLVKYRIQTLCFILFIYSFGLELLMLLFWSHFQGFQTILTILELSVSFSKLLVHHSFDSVIFHQMSSSIMEQKDQQVQCFSPIC